MARAATVLILAAESGLTHYFAQIRRFPMLERQEEYVLAKRWREHGDRDAAHKLVTSHLRLVTKIASDYRGYDVRNIGAGANLASKPSPAMGDTADGV
jgi:RNA polymerase sigma-32 factor